MNLTTSLSQRLPPRYSSLLSVNTDQTAPAGPIPASPSAANPIASGPILSGPILSGLILSGPVLEPAALFAATSLLLSDTHTNVLYLLEQMPRHERQRYVVHSQNPCPEYLDDLWQLGPRLLLTGPQTQHSIERALEQALERASRYTTSTPATSPFHSSLIPSERILLRYLPSGLSNKHIAKRLRLSDRTVRNRLVDIAEKLGLENRTQMAMYYAGQWQWLERYRHGLEPWHSDSATAAD
jgi:DNA-binding NarL/FixJ family response regulator